MAGDDSEVTVNAFGKSFSIKGFGTIFIVVVLAFSSGLAWMLYDLSHSAAIAIKETLVVQAQISLEHRAIMDTAVILRENQTVIMLGVKEVGESVRVQNYILLENEKGKDRIKAKMSMPKQLRDLLNDR